jgi:hypothetical protein
VPSHQTKIFRQSQPPMVSDETLRFLIENARQLNEDGSVAIYEDGKVIEK